MFLNLHILQFLSRGRSTQLSGQQHANIITLFQFNSRIVVENCVVGICYNGMFLGFMSLKRNIWLAYINGIQLQYILNIC